MREYLATTTLGDLQRKSNSINIAEELGETASTSVSTTETTAPSMTATETRAHASSNNTERPSPFSSLIRSSVGEVNQ